MERRDRSGDVSDIQGDALLAVVLLALAFVLLGLTIIAAQSVDHAALVAAAKQQVVAAGIDPDASDCARWEVTRRVAKALESEGVGLIAKGGSNCNGFATDAIMYHDGTVVDVLGAGGEGPNTPHWLIQPGKRPASDWRAPVDVDPVTAPDPPPSPPPASPPPPNIDLAALDQKLDRILTELETLQHQGLVNAEKTDHVESRLNDVVNGAKLGIGKWLPGLLAGGVAAGACAAK